MNILLLFVSTLHIPKDKETGSNHTSIYSAYKDIDGERESYPYLSQVEPGSKYFFNKLAEKGQQFGRVIALCTKETLDGVSFSVDGTDIRYEDISAYEIYRRRMTDFLRGSDTRENETFVKAVKTASPETVMIPTPFFDTELYSEDELRGLFQPVEISFDGSAFAENISNIVEAITEQTDEDIDLYFNAQGGLRTNVQIINAVLNMLQSRNVKLKEVSSINFNNKNRENPLIDETEHYLINDLAAALDAFLEYGRGDMFVKYYERYKKRRGIKKMPEDDIVSYIKKISDSILLCNVDDFGADIKELKNLIKGYGKNKKKNKQDSFFKVMISDIERDYGDLMKKPDNLIEQVRWCLKKDLLQQALTLLESRSPEYMMNCGFLYYTDNAEVESAVKALGNGYAKLPNELKDMRNFIIKNYLNSDENNTSDRNLSLAVKKDEKKLSELIAGKMTFSLEFGNNTADVTLGSKWLEGNSVEEFENIMAAFSEICTLRNNANHANKKSSESIDTIRNKIGDFIKILEEIGNTDFDFSVIDCKA